MESALDSVYTPTPVEDPPAHARAAVAIDEGNLRDEIVRLPSDLAYYGHQFALASREQIAAKLSLAEVESMVYLEVRETLEDLSDKGKKPTEATISSRVDTDHRVRDARALMIAAEFNVAQVRAHVDAVRAKREMLIALGQLARAEMGPTQVRDPFKDNG